MVWDGIDRRKEIKSEFCSAHIQQSNDIVEIKTSLKNIEKGITQGVSFKTAMVSAVVLIVLTLIGQAVLYGRLMERTAVNAEINLQLLSEVKILATKVAINDKQVEINTARWNRWLDEQAGKKK